MANIDFPPSPVDGEEYSQNNSTWVWSAAKTTWEATTTDLGTEGVILKAFREDINTTATYEVDFTHGNFAVLTMTVAGAIQITGMDADVASPMTILILDADQFAPTFGSEFTWRDNELPYWPEVPRGLLEIVSLDAIEYLIGFAGTY